jgi:hypothetical protein
VHGLMVEALHKRIARKKAPVRTMALMVLDFFNFDAVLVLDRVH